MKISQTRLNELDCVLGLDCSKYQKDINWKKAKAAGIEFAFIKLTEGTDYYEGNIYNVEARAAAAQANGVKIGYYHFARPGNVEDPVKDALDEVNNLATRIKLLPVANLPFVLDIESYSNTIVWDDKVDHMTKFIYAFLDKMKELKMPVIIYSYKTFLNLNTFAMLGRYPLWIAAYVKDPEVNLPSLPIGWTSWNIWQFTEKGEVDGYVGDIDLNVMKKSFYNLY